MLHFAQYQNNSATLSSFDLLESYSYVCSELNNKNVMQVKRLTEHLEVRETQKTCYPFFSLYFLIRNGCSVSWLVRWFRQQEMW